MYARDVRFDAHGGYSLYGSASHNKVDIYGGSSGKTKYNSDSSIDIEGGSLVGGLSKQFYGSKTHVGSVWRIWRR
ncbi:MAG: hypothetical protein LBG23_02140 [Endomicrobium sp.]|jgi:hypothetical protein|nr:hypothetical protein [Endomicrobium sp.]